MKVAIVHDWLTNMGGSEKVVLQLHKLYPNAPIYTSVYNPEKVDRAFRDIEVIPSVLQKFPLAKRKYQQYLPFMPMAFELFDLRKYDLILSSNHACSKGIVPPPHALHICYSHTPMRYAWSGFHEYREHEQVGWLKRKLMAPLLHYLRMWDRQSADRVDHFIANSTEVAQRIRKYYRRDSMVIHPPVHIPNKSTSIENEGYYLIVSRLVAYKRIDLAIEAFNRLGKPLLVIGDGPERKRLERLAGPTVKMLGKRDDQEVQRSYQSCKAFVFPGEEDFGITPIEAQSYGKPVIAYGKGGALDTVIEDRTGLFFDVQTVDALVETVQAFESRTFDPYRIQLHASGFSEAVFRRKIADFIEEKFRESR